MPTTGPQPQTLPPSTNIGQHNFGEQPFSSNCKLFMETMIAAASYSRSVQTDVRGYPRIYKDDPHRAQTGSVSLPYGNGRRDEDRYSMYSSGYSENDDESTMEEGTGYRRTNNKGDFQDAETAPTGERRGSRTRVVAGPPLQDIGLCRSFQVEGVEGTLPAEDLRAEMKPPEDKLENRHSTRIPDSKVIRNAQ
jgi:hypothetical protein